jgi:DNA-directed RNA polymerase subunit RPC12/RpoP
MIRFRCPSCSKTLLAADPSAGNRTRCKNCAAVVRIPAAAAVTVTAVAPAPDPWWEETDAEPVRPDPCKCGSDIPETEFEEDGAELVAPPEPAPQTSSLVTCGDCGSPVSPKAAACPRCGNPLSIIVDNTKEKCPYCGKNTVGKAHGLQGFLELFMGVFLSVFGCLILGVLFYFDTSSIPFCSNCRRRVRS